MEKYEIIHNAELHSNKLYKILKRGDLSKHGMYAKTVDRCKALKQQLLDCVAILDSWLKAQSETEEGQQDIEIVEQVEEIDAVEPKLENSSPKIILKEYCASIQKFEESRWNIYEINMCARMLHSWFNCRFIPKTVNPKFYYKAIQLPSWIDKIIITFGRAIHDNRAHIYISEMSDWASSLSTDFGNVWAVPYFVQSQWSNGNEPEIVLEAVIIEHFLKKELYADEFFSTYRHTIKNHYEDRENVSLDLTHVEEYVYSSNLTVIGDFK